MPVISATQAPGRSVPPASAGERVEEGAGAAGGVGADQCRPYRPQVWGQSRQGESGGLEVSAAVLEPALAGPSSVATGSPDPDGPWSTNAPAESHRERDIQSQWHAPLIWGRSTQRGVSSTLRMRVATCMLRRVSTSLRSCPVISRMRWRR